MSETDARLIGNLLLVLFLALAAACQHFYWEARYWKKQADLEQRRREMEEAQTAILRRRLWPHDE